MDGDTDGSKSNKKPVLWQVHTDDVTNHAAAYVAKLPLPPELKDAIAFAARWHDLGKRRKLFQAVLNNCEYPDTVLAKSGKKGGRVPELYRHEFGSLVDVLDEGQPYRAELHNLSPDMQELVQHLIAVHHGYGRPHFPVDQAFDPEPKGQKVDEIAAAVTQRFARLQRRYGRWGLAYLESLLRAADYAASARPSACVEAES
jgi:CRISPR-associated endonuclease/helicase Cas3